MSLQSRWHFSWSELECWVGEEAGWKLQSQWPAELPVWLVIQFGCWHHNYSIEPVGLICSEGVFEGFNARGSLVSYGLNFSRFQEPLQWTKNHKRARILKRGKVKAQWKVLSMLALALFWCTCKTHEVPCLKRSLSRALLFLLITFSKTLDGSSILSLPVLLSVGRWGQPFLTGAISYHYDSQIKKP